MQKQTGKVIISFDIETSRKINSTHDLNLIEDEIIDILLEKINSIDKEIKLKNNKITTIKYIPGTHCFAYSPWYD